MNASWIAPLPFLTFFVWLLFAERGKTCPDCRRPLPRFQSPFTKTRRQWAEGGFVCPDCGCETDLAGNKVAAGMAPQPRWILVGVALPMLLALTAFVLTLATAGRP